MEEEFLAPLRGSVPVSIEALADELCAAGRFVIESATPEMARFRWASAPRRDHWPEDATLYLHQGDLLLNVHTGSGQERDQIVEAVRVAASKLLSEPVTFEEL